MADSKATAVQPALATELTPELVAFVEDTALRDDHALAPQCRKVLRSLRAGTPLAAIEPELRPIVLDFAAQTASSEPSVAGATMTRGPNAVTVSKSFAAEWNKPLVPLTRLFTALSPQAAPADAASELEALGRKLFLSVKEASVYAGLPASTIRRMIAKQALPAVKAGGWRIQRKYLEALSLRHLRQVSASNF